MRLTRRHALGVVPLLAASGRAYAQAQPWPTRPVRLVVPFPPGGVADVLARPLAQILTDRLGQPVVVENRGGAAGTIGAAFVAKAAPDGHTLLFGTANELTMTPPLRSDLPYDPLTAFAPVTPVGAFPNVLVVRTAHPAQDAAALIALAKASREPLTYASSGIGSTNHLSGAMFAEMAGLKLNHIPYNGGGPALNDVLAGNVDMLFATQPSAMGLLRGGALRGLLVTDRRRSPALPDVPSAAEVGLTDLLVSTWNGVLAPAGTPEPVIQRLHQEITTALTIPSLREHYAAAGAQEASSTPAEFLALIRDDLRRWGEFIRRAGIRLE